MQKVNIKTNVFVVRCRTKRFFFKFLCTIPDSCLNQGRVYVTTPQSEISRVSTSLVRKTVKPKLSPLHHKQ